jgi:hypothetical protein
VTQTIPSTDRRPNTYVHLAQQQTLPTTRSEQRDIYKGRDTTSTPPDLIITATAIVIEREVNRIKEEEAGRTEWTEDHQLYVISYFLSSSMPILSESLHESSVIGCSRL